MYRIIRTVHLSVALFSLPFLLAYAVSAMQLAHRKWLPLSERSTTEDRQLTPGITDARQLARHWRGEVTSISASPAALKFRISRLGTRYDVTYSVATGEASIKTTTSGFLAILDQIHGSRGPWTYAAALVSLALLILGATGLFLWFQSRLERRIGFVFLAAGAAICLILVTSMRAS
jgi:hypothetical protein